MYMTYLANPTWDNPNSLLSDVLARAPEQKNRVRTTNGRGRSLIYDQVPPGIANE